MRLAGIETEVGWLRGRYEDGVVRVDGVEYTVGEDATMAAPCRPSIVYCVGRNYPAYIEENQFERPEHVSFFLKPPASVHPPGADLPHPAWTDGLKYGGELAAVVGRRCREVAPDEVPDHLRGYTIVNDVDASDQGRITMRKAFDGAAPIGPWIETDVDPFDLEMTTTIAGEQRQADTTASMLFDPHTVVSFLSERFTLRPDDVVALGSPANPGFVTPGDEMAITYEGIGTLRNRVVAP